MSIQRVRKQKDGCLEFQCPGCKLHHFLSINPAKHPHWSFNGDYEKPTFSPSILVQRSYGDEDFVCHSYVEDGKIRFLTDCTHDKAGQTVEIQPW